MTARPSPSVLTATALALWAATAAIVAAAVLAPYRLPPADPTVARVAAKSPATVPAVAFDDLLDLNLRRPLVDPPATAPSAVAALAVGPDVRLAGIVAEPGHSFAMFVTPAGATEVRTVGQRAGTAEVVAITPTAVTVRFGGRMTTMRLPVASPIR